MALVNPYLQVDGLTKRIGDRVLFEHISFGIAERATGRLDCQERNR